MYGGSSKLGRGGGPRNRSSFPPPPAHRPSSATKTGRLSLGSGPRNRPHTGGGSGAAPAVEESFSLVSGNNPLAFSMIIRLAPDLVEEIKRLEAQGETAKIKFDSIPTHPTGNVIDVGGKEFRFTWSREFGDLCDIYEERQMGEDGNRLLVESGCAWRKLNVQRVLDESTTNHVKMLSEEAERKHKSRKAIILDHGNPSMKNQIKQLAAAEASPWKSHFKKKEQIASKKRKVETPQAAVVGPPKSVYKSGLLSAASAKGKRSSSPLPSPPERSGATASPIGIGNTTKTSASSEDILPPQVKSKESISSSEKEIPTITKAISAVREMRERRESSGHKPMDLQSLLISQLKENPKGLSLKALEKAVGDTIPNSTRKIEPIVKKIATFQAPGRYFLKPGVELESLKKSSHESGSSPEDNRHQAPALEENQDQTPAPASLLVENVTRDEMVEETPLDFKARDESNALEQIDILQHSPDMDGEKKASDHIEGPANSASDSGSDSDSDSDSSDSSRRSRSASPAASGSGSSSDSESDASSNSKEGSDEHVDIMTSDDDKETKQDTLTSEPGLLTSPVPWQAEHDRSLQNGMDENQDDDGSDAVDIDGDGSDAVNVDGLGSGAVDTEKDLLEEEQEIGMAANTNKGGKHDERTEPFSSDPDEFQERQNFMENLFDDTENTIKNSEKKRKAKSKRGSDLKHIDGKSERSKRLKSESLSQPPVCGSRDAEFFGSSRPIDEPYQSSNIGDREHADSQKGYNHVFPIKSSTDFHQSGRRSSESGLGAQTKAVNTAERPLKHTESSGHGSKFAEKNVHEGYINRKDNPSRDTYNEDGLMKEKKFPTNPKEGVAEGKNVVPSDFHLRKHGETVGKSKDAGQISGSYNNSSPKDNNRINEDRYPANGKSNALQRELSHLELGEIREPLIEETPIKKQFEGKISSKQSGSRPSTSENNNPDLNRGKPVGKTHWDSSGKTSSPNQSGRKRTPEHHVEDLSRSHHRVAQSQMQQLSRFDRPEAGSHFNRLADNSKTKQTEIGAKLGVGPVDYGESQKKTPASAPQQQESKQGSVSQIIKESKLPTSNKMPDMTGTRKNAVLKEGKINGRKKRGSSSDEDYLPYFKYEKDQPDLREPIKDSSQYEEYVSEFHEKYESYKDLDKTLQTYRNEFEKLGKDLEYSKDRDKEKYYKTLDQLMESYHQCGMRHKRLKKIFVVLHQELKNRKQRLVEYAESRTTDS